MSKWWGLSPEGFQLYCSLSKSADVTVNVVCVAVLSGLVGPRLQTHTAAFRDVGEYTQRLHTCIFFSRF